MSDNPLEDLFVACDEALKDADRTGTVTPEWANPMRVALACCRIKRTQDVEKAKPYPKDFVANCKPFTGKPKGRAPGW